MVVMMNVFVGVVLIDFVSSSSARSLLIVVVKFVEIVLGVMMIMFYLNGVCVLCCSVLCE